ncbi:hypothetical protein A9Q99_26075 [Gammaproteobacteria bacterium 45_16_T64]|nr:hypothetical protein A9Q99_26075 [Gammaproteobacteria bacterium 45_16_T64]
MVSRRLPVAGHALEFLLDPHKIIRRGYEEHGLIFSIDLGIRKAVVMLGPEYHEFFFKETDGVFSMRKGYETYQKMFDKQMLMFTHSTEYKEQMGVIMPLLKHNDRFLPLMLEETNNFMDTLLGESGSQNITDAFGPVVMHIGARAFFGENFRNKLGDEYFNLYRDFSRGADVVLPSWLPLPKFKRSQKAKRHLESMFVELIEERRRNPLEPGDLLQDLVEATYSNGKPLADEVLVSMMLFIPWAAHETTVGAAGWTLIDLLQNPEYLEKVKKELTAVLGEGQDYTAGKLKKLHCLDWAILESERMHPVAHLIMRGVREDIEFDKYQIKQGSMLFVAPETAHNIPEVFKHPEKYDPERFSPERKEGSRKFSLIGFGGGAHRCAGVNFAKLEQKILVAKLLQNYDIKLLTKNPKPQPGIDTAWPATPTLIQYKRRRK